MEDIDGGLHPAVDGQSLDEDDKDCETWTIAADIERRIQALEMRCFCKLLGILYRNHITNEEVKARIGNASGPYEDLTSVKRHKLKQYGHVT